MRDDPFGQLLELEGLLRAARMDVAAGEAQTWTGLGFRIGQAWLVAPREDVREVLPPPSTTRVPNAKPWLRGMANVRVATVDVSSFSAGYGAIRAILREPASLTIAGAPGKSRAHRATDMPRIMATARACCSWVASTAEATAFMR